MRVGSPGHARAPGRFPAFVSVVEAGLSGGRRSCAFILVPDGMPARLRSSCLTRSSLIARNQSRTWLWRGLAVCRSGSGRPAKCTRRRVRRSLFQRCHHRGRFYTLRKHRAARVLLGSRDHNPGSNNFFRCISPEPGPAPGLHQHPGGDVQRSRAVRSGPVGNGCGRTAGLRLAEAEVDL